MIELYDEVVGALERGESAAIATLIARLGSAPGALGSKMLVRSNGTTTGTVGGGCIEADVWQAGVSALRTGEPAVLSFRLSPSDMAESGLICGGSVDILVEAPQSRHLPLYLRLVETLKHRGRAMMGTVIPTGCAKAPATIQDPHPPGLAPGDKFLVCSDGEVVGYVPAGTVAEMVQADLDAGIQSGVRVVKLEIERRRVSIVLESLVPPSTIYVFGAGHLARELVPLAKRVGFRVVVIDDRAFFASRENFPEADEVIVADFGRALDELRLEDDSFLVIVTRGHQHDEVVLKQALRVRPSYIGMIGSHAKIATIYRQLRAEGFSQEELETVHAPIGLPIGAQSPEEIAISILAELISVRNQML